MKQFEVKIKGLSPYLQHRMDDQKLEDWEKQRGAIIERPDVAKTDAVRAEYHAYRDSDNKCYIPAEHLIGSFINAGAMVKSKVGNARKSMKNIVAGMFDLKEEKILMPDYDAVDKRSAVNKNVKARVIAIRPRWNSWDADFTLKVDNDTITDSTIREIITNAGQYIGIGSFRPTNNGKFGRFELVSMNEIK